MTLIDQIKKDREAGTPGPWKAPYETFDNGWTIDTEGENAAVGVGVECIAEDQPIAIVAVNCAFGMDDLLDANARRIARVPDMEAALLAAEELAVAAADFDIALSTPNAAAGSARVAMNEALAAYCMATNHTTGED